MKKTASFNMDTDSNKLWRLTKQLNDEENRHAKITLLQDRKMVHGKQAATFLPIPTKKQVIYQLSYTNKNTCAQNTGKYRSLSTAEIEYLKS